MDATINSNISSALTNTGGATGVTGRFFRSNFGGSPIFPNVVPAPAGGSTGGDIVVFSPDHQNPMIHQADIVFEHTIARNTVISASGLFSWGRKLPTFVDSNLGPITGSRTFNAIGGPFGGQSFTVNTYFGGTRPNTNFSKITEKRGVLSSRYAALVLQLNRRLTDGLQFKTSYTFSDSEDNGQTSLTFAPFAGNVPADPNNLSLEEGKSNFHIPHRFITSLVYAPDTILGLGKNSGAAKAILSGWSIAPIVTIQSGRRYSAGIDDDLIGANGSRFYHGARRNGFSQPAIGNVDLRVSRRFNFSDSKSFEFFIEGFNIFNRQNITRVNTRAYIHPGRNTGASADLNFNGGNRGFGTPTAAGNNIFRERQVQISARFRF